RGRPPVGQPNRGRPRRDGGSAAAADPARTVALAALRAVADSDAYANLVLPRLLRERQVRGRDAAMATELTYGVLRMRGLYDAILAAVSDRPLDAVDPAVLDALRLGVHQLVTMRTPPHAAVSATVGAARATVGAGASGFVNAVLRRVADGDPDGWTDRVAPAPGPGAADGDRVLAVRHSHPEWIVRALRQALVAAGRDPGELPALLAADNLAPEVTLLARPGVTTPAEVTAAARRARAREGRWSPYAWRLDEGGSPGDLPEVRSGRFRVADEGSQLAALALLGPAVDAGVGEAGGGGERWLDLCAGPGGKSALLSGEAVLRGASGVSVEVRPQRADLVRAAVAGAEDRWQVRTDDGRETGRTEPGAYHRVLADVPCTGLGALRRRPEARWRRTPGDLATLALLQRALLDSALRACRPGGVVAYVTCSPHVAETRAVVDDAVRAGRRGRGPAAELLDARPDVAGRDGAPLPELGDGPAVQLWPHLHGTDAMFIALLRRADP
ncbi:MAG: RsmB/NOP family class I SAM-dependent RNA methyltransferase, partial [Kineosporiaceae bacterium]